MPPNETERRIHTAEILQCDSNKRVENDTWLFGKYTVFGVRFPQELKYFNAISIIIFNIVCAYALLTYDWIGGWKLVLFSYLYGCCAGFGVTAGAHRYFTHRTYKAKTPLKILLLILYAAAGHNRLRDWVRDHRIHHKFSETDADPHNSKRGFFFSHVGWLMMKKHPDVIEKGKSVDMSDIIGDPLLVWYDKHFNAIKIFFCFILPVLVVRYGLGESWYWSIMSQVFARYVTLLNLGSLVNSAAHLYGYQPYDKSIHPKENLFVGIVGLGEGWHNYHHTFPWDYKASEYGRINVTTYILDIFGKLGLAYDFRYASDDLVKKVCARNQATQSTE